MQWNDNQKARIISEDQSNKFREPKDDTIIRSQDDIYDYYEKFAQQQKNEI